MPATTPKHASSTTKDFPSHIEQFIKRQKPSFLEGLGHKDGYKFAGCSLEALTEKQMEAIIKVALSAKEYSKKTKTFEGGVKLSRSKDGTSSQASSAPNLPRSLLFFNTPNGARIFIVHRFKFEFNKPMASAGRGEDAKSNDTETLVTSALDTGGSKTFGLLQELVRHKNNNCLGLRPGEFYALLKTEIMTPKNDKEARLAKQREILEHLMGITTPCKFIRRAHPTGWANVAERLRGQSATLSVGTFDSMGGPNAPKVNVQYQAANFLGDNLHREYCERNAITHTPDALLATFTQQLLACWFANAGLGITHKDIKAENYLRLDTQCESKDRLDTKPIANLIDIGECQLQTPAPGAISELAGAVGTGTDTYRAPEVEQMFTSSPASDMYSLGVTLNRMLNKKQSDDEITNLLGQISEQMRSEMLHQRPTAAKLLNQLKSNSATSRVVLTVLKNHHKMLKKNIEAQLSTLNLAGIVLPNEAITQIKKMMDQAQKAPLVDPVAESWKLQAIKTYLQAIKLYPKLFLKNMPKDCSSKSLTPLWQYLSPQRLQTVAQAQRLMRKLTATVLHSTFAEPPAETKHQPSQSLSIAQVVLQMALSWQSSDLVPDALQQQFAKIDVNCGLSPNALLPQQMCTLTRTLVRQRDELWQRTPRESKTSRQVLRLLLSPCMYFDPKALTLWQNPAECRNNGLDAIASFLAFRELQATLDILGKDPKYALEFKPLANPNPNSKLPKTNLPIILNTIKGSKTHSTHQLVHALRRQVKQVDKLTRYKRALINWLGHLANSNADCPDVESACRSAQYFIHPSTRDKWLTGLRKWHAAVSPQATQEVEPINNMKNFDTWLQTCDSQLIARCTLDNPYLPPQPLRIATILQCFNNTTPVLHNAKQIASAAAKKLVKPSFVKHLVEQSEKLQKQSAPDPQALLLQSLKLRQHMERTMKGPVGRGMQPKNPISSHKTGRGTP